MPFRIHCSSCGVQSLPTLAVAVTRRVIGVAAAAYFDDVLTVDIAALAHHAQQCTANALRLVGAPPETLTPAYHRVYLGAVVDVGAVMDTGEVICSPKHHTVHRVIEHVNEVAVSRSFPSGRASKLRGIAGWVGSHLCGKCGRLALSVR